MVTHDISNEELTMKKAEAGIAPDMSGCHTAFIGDYVVEGHVPADDIRKLLSEAPDIRGIAVPGMPMGSPGMEGSRSDPYNTMAISHDGETTVFAKH